MSSTKGSSRVVLLSELKNCLVARHYTVAIRGYSAYVSLVLDNLVVPLRQLSSMNESLSCQLLWMVSVVKGCSYTSEIFPFSRWAHLKGQICADSRLQLSWIAGKHFNRLITSLPAEGNVNNYWATMGSVQKQDLLISGRVCILRNYFIVQKV